MPRNVWEIPIDENTSREDLERCRLEANHTSDTNVLRVAAQALAEIDRRSRQVWVDRFDAQEQARIKAQKFQEAQNTRLIEAQEEMIARQLEVAQKQAEAATRQVESATKQVEAAEKAAEAARQTAAATKWLAVLTAILVLTTALPFLWEHLPKAMIQVPITTPTNPTTK
jgi:hypothetical protein